MKQLIFIFAVAFFLANFIPLIAEEGEKEDCNREWVCLIEVEDKTGIELFIRNKNSNPNTAVSLRLDANLTNLVPSVSLPIYTVIRGNKPNSILKLEYKEPGKYAFRSFAYRIRPGDWDSEHDDSVIYQLPFSTESKIRLTQGYHGKITHQGQFAYALDFLMDIGTPIYAARAGFVTAIEDRFLEGGFRPDLISKANFIIIQHEDGTLANYAHLKQKGVAVLVGEKVEKGQLIGYSGNTGYTQGPHLHFEVHKPNKNFEVTTIPTFFKTQYSEKDTLKQFFTYWHPKQGELPPSSPIDSENIYLCRLTKTMDKENCGTDQFKVGEKMLLYLQFDEPGNHKVFVEVSKEEGDMDPIKIDWNSKLENLYEGRYFEWKESPNMLGKWNVRFLVNGEEKKKIRFEVKPKVEKR